MDDKESENQEQCNVQKKPISFEFCSTNSPNPRDMGQRKAANPHIRGAETSEDKYLTS